jgi:hypothetical protein
MNVITRMVPVPADRRFGCRGSEVAVNLHKKKIVCP